VCKSIGSIRIHKGVCVGWVGVGGRGWESLALDLGDVVVERGCNLCGGGGMMASGRVKWKELSRSLEEQMYLGRSRGGSFRSWEIDHESIFLTEAREIYNQAEIEHALSALGLV